MIITSYEYNIRNNYNSMQLKNKCVVVDLNRFLVHITFAAIDRFRSMDQQSKAIANYTQNNFYNIQVLSSSEPCCFFFNVGLFC